MATECPGCEARADEIKHLRMQVADLMDRSIAAANPTLYAHLKNPHPSNEPALSHFEDGLGNAYVTVDGKAVPLKDWQKFISEKGGYLDDQGHYVPAEEYNRALAVVSEMMGGNVPTQ